MRYGSSVSADIDRGSSAPDGSAFAVTYLALFLILWCLILRGISIEVGGHINDRLWQSFWIHVRLLNFLLAILFVAAAGTSARCSRDAHGNFSDGLLTDFNVAGTSDCRLYTVSLRFSLSQCWPRTARPISRSNGRSGADRSEKWARYLWIGLSRCFCGPG